MRPARAWETGRALRKGEGNERSATGETLIKDTQDWSRLTLGTHCVSRAKPHTKTVASTLWGCCCLDPPLTGGETKSVKHLAKGVRRRQSGLTPGRLTPEPASPPQLWEAERPRGQDVHSGGDVARCHPPRGCQWLGPLWAGCLSAGGSRGCRVCKFLTDTSLWGSGIRNQNSPSSNYSASCNTVFK